MSARAQTVLGFFVFTLAVYILSAPGRIDSIDGQTRYEVTQNLVSFGEPVLRDPWLAGGGVPGLEGKRYSFYNASPSLAAYPLVWLGGQFDDPQAEKRRFLFSLTTAFFGAGLAALLVLFWTDLGVPLRRAAGWSAVHAFATLAWPASTTVLDQVQQGFWVLLAAWLVFRAARQRSVLLAVGGCLALAVLINHQPNFVLLVPTLALAGLSPPAATAERRTPRWAIPAVFLLGAPLGIGLSFYYNIIRFGTPFFLDRLNELGDQPPFFGSPIDGLLGLLFSPGKSILLYSPVVLLAVAGWFALRRRWKWLAWAAAGTFLMQLVFTAFLSFWHGDWCWGPRYLMVVLPLVSLGLAFLDLAGWKKGAAYGLIAAGLGVQLLGLGVVHERFFFENRQLNWPRPGHYFHVSAWLTRPGEVWQIVTEGPPAEAVQFAPTPYPETETYYITGVLPDEDPVEWMRGYQVFYRLRPWTFWLPTLPPKERPVPFALPLIALLLTAAGGGALAARGLRRAGQAAAP
ncbi:MAG: hypothetical protein AAF481_10520 [Acidobacteriota bacterium]